MMQLFLLIISYYSIKALDCFFENSHHLFYSISLTFNPHNWGVFVDTKNPYFMVYDPPGSQEWSIMLINETSGLKKGENTTIENYDKQIPVTSYSSSIKLKRDENYFDYHYYYTKEKCSDELVWEYIHPNYRQFSIGFGLNVEDPKYSFIDLLNKNGIISKRRFSFIPPYNLVIGPYPEAELNNLSNATYYIPSHEKNWGFHINSISIEKRRYKINKYVEVNSGIPYVFRSYKIYSIFKRYLLGNEQFKKKCSENLNNRTIECEIEESSMNHNITIDIGNGIQFSVPLNKFFKWSGSISSSLMIFYDQNEDDKSLENEIMEVGMNFMQLFDNVQFDFDYKNISFYSSTISIIKSNDYWSLREGITIYLLIFMSGLMIIFSCLLFIKNYSNEILNKLN